MLMFLPAAGAALQSAVPPPLALSDIIDSESAAAASALLIAAVVKPEPELLDEPRTGDMNEMAHSSSSDREARTPAPSPSLLPEEEEDALLSFFVSESTPPSS
jgi:hypothetical protein